jgi:glycosyltransferase A (GT-A) superfamily protein (DUF2064 family)
VVPPNAPKQLLLPGKRKERLRRLLGERVDVDVDKYMAEDAVVVALQVVMTSLAKVVTVAVQNQEKEKPKQASIESVCCAVQAC